MSLYSTTKGVSSVIIDALSEFFKNIAVSLKGITFADFLDIAVVAVILYYVFKFIRDRRAGRLAVGIIILLVLLIVSDLLEMKVVEYLMRNVFQIGIIALFIVFQPELRAALEKVGGSFGTVRSLGEKNNETHSELVSTVAEAAMQLSSTKTGALIVFERNTKLGDLVLTGTVIDAEVSSQLIGNIFFNKSPLHDGALIIRDSRLYAAGCLLPLSSSTEINKELGTRHRAAIGMTENSDAVVLVVSEETGVISLAFNGKLERNFGYDSLREELTNLLTDETLGRATIKNRFEHFKNTRSLKRTIEKSSDDEE